MAAEQINDAQGPAIMLTQQGEYSEPSTVLVHPWQLRAVCEEFGIIASDTQAEKTIAMLTRRLLALRDRIDRLHNYLVNHSDHKHADLSYEVTYATASIDLADEFCAELEDVEPPCAASQSTPAPTKAAPAASSQASLI